MKGLLLSLSAKKLFKSVNIWKVTGKNVVVSCTLCARPTHCSARRRRTRANLLVTLPNIHLMMSRKTLGILDGGRGGGVDRSWRRRGIKGVDKGGA